MKNSILLFLFIFVFAGAIYSQVSIDKFISDKLDAFDPKEKIAPTDFKQKPADDKLEGIPVKVIETVYKDGRLAAKSITNALLNAKDAKKLWTVLTDKLSAKLGKKYINANNELVKSRVWSAADGTHYILTSKKNITALMKMRKYSNQ